MLKSAHLQDPAGEKDKIPRQGKYARYIIHPRGNVIKKRHHKACWKAWHSTVATWQGDIVACCFDKDGDHVFGNLHEKKLEEIWHGHVYAAFRERLIKNKEGIDICKACSI
jgi:radical SAM protein with 4Fe4S-binding SPASM domain